MPIPESPTEDSIKLVLAELPLPPWHTLLVADRPNKNGHLYTKECLEKAMVSFQERVDKKIMLVHAARHSEEPNMLTALGLVEQAEFDGESINIQVKFFDSKWDWLAAHGVKLTFSGRMLAGVGYDLKVENLYVDAVYASVAGREDLE